MDGSAGRAPAALPHGGCDVLPGSNGLPPSVAVRRLYSLVARLAVVLSPHASDLEAHVEGGEPLLDGLVDAPVHDLVAGVDHPSLPQDATVVLAAEVVVEVAIQQGVVLHNFGLGLDSEFRAPGRAMSSRSVHNWFPFFEDKLNK